MPGGRSVLSTCSPPSMHCPTTPRCSGRKARTGVKTEPTSLWDVGSRGRPPGCRVQHFPTARTQGRVTVGPACGRGGIGIEVGVRAAERGYRQTGRRGRSCPPDRFHPSSSSSSLRTSIRDPWRPDSRAKTGLGCDRVPRRGLPSINGRTRREQALRVFATTS